MRWKAVAKCELVMEHSELKRMAKGDMRAALHHVSVAPVSFQMEVMNDRSHAPELRMAAGMQCQPTAIDVVGSRVRSPVLWFSRITRSSWLGAPLYLRGKLSSR